MNYYVYFLIFLFCSMYAFLKGLFDAEDSSLGKGLAKITIPVAAVGAFMALMGIYHLLTTFNFIFAFIAEAPLSALIFLLGITLQISLGTMLFIPLYFMFNTTDAQVVAKRTAAYHKKYAHKERMLGLAGLVFVLIDLVRSLTY